MSRMSSLNNAAQIFAGACVRTSADTGTDKHFIFIVFSAKLLTAPYTRTFAITQLADINIPSLHLLCVNDLNKIDL